MRSLSRSLLAGVIVISSTVWIGGMGNAALNSLSPREDTTPTSVIAIDTNANAGTVNKAALGHAFLWPFHGMGSFDPTSEQFYAKFLHELDDVIQPGSIRYPGGITAESFHWLRAVGPQSKRSPNAFSPTSGPSPSTVGPDEFGQLLDRTGATGIVTVNFGTGTAAEAAAFVAYMTGEPGSSVWADLRAANGHREPYNVPWWEVGNEEWGAKYWRSGQPVSVGGPPNACRNVATCLYLYGGATRFTRQRVVGYADRTEDAAVSRGTPNQVFYVAYPPVVPSSATIYVDDVPWTRVDSLSDARSTEHVYTLHPGTGAIQFGDGNHGAIPPPGAVVTATYVSGPHDGLVQFYQAMKAANPHIFVCSADETADFVASAGSTVPYDCLQHHHNYASSGDVPDDLPIDEYQRQIMSVPEKEATATMQLEQSIVAAAGHPVPLVVSEYGQLLKSNPDGYPYYHLSLDEALLNASQLIAFLNLGIPVVNRQLLTAEIPPPDRCCNSLPSAAPFATTAAIGTPGPDTVLEATGMVYHLFAPTAGHPIIPSRVLANPSLAFVRGENIGTLSTFATSQEDGVYLIVINRSPDDDVRARVALEGASVTGQVSWTELNGASSLSYNTLSAPQSVRFVKRSLSVDGSAFDVTFPRHSVVALRMPAHEIPTLRTGFDVDLHPTVAAPGAHLTLRATVSNTSDRSISGVITPVLPTGWRVDRSSRSIDVAANSSTSVDFTVTVRTDAAERSYDLAALLSVESNGSPVIVGADDANIIVRLMRSWKVLFTDNFDTDPIGTIPEGYRVSGSISNFTVQPSPDGVGHALRVQKTSSSEGQITADRSFAPVTGPLQMRVRAWAAQTDTALGVQVLDAKHYPVLRLSLATNGDLAWTRGGEFFRGASYTSGRWYELEVDIDPASGTYKLYVDNLLLAQPMLETSREAPAMVRLQMPKSPSTPGTFYVDDVTVAVPTVT